jgi:cell division septation protein DedD
LYRDVTAIPQDELFFKLGMSEKMQDNPDSANHWFEKVVELYATGTYAGEARRLHTKLGPAKSADSKFFSVELGSFKDEAEALKEAEIYRKKGYRQVHVVKIPGMLEPSYSVRIGKYYNRNDAKRAEDDAQLAGMRAFAKRGKEP